MKIEFHIKNLLARYGRVSVTGQGVFRCINERARIEGGKILPPVTRIAFERCNAETDRMLVESVMKDNNFGWNEAHDYIKNTSIDIDGILKRWDYLPQNFGLHPVEMPTVRTMPMKWIDAKYAAVVAVAALLNIMIPLNGVRDNINEAGIGFEAMQKVVMPVTEEVSALEIPATDESSEEIIVEKMKYVIVVASFDTRESAMRCIIDQKVPEAIEVIEKDGRFRVCGMRFAEYDKANEYIRQNSLKAWVMKL